MLINDYKIEFNWEVSCCVQWQSATVRLPEDIGQALLHLASIINDAKYEATTNSLHLAKDSSRRHIYVYPDRIYISYIKSEEEAYTLIEWTKSVLNEAHSELTRAVDSKIAK